MSAWYCAGVDGRTTPGTRRPIFHVFEIGDDGQITYAGRFDEDDFDGAYRELERRYYAGEGAAFAQNGRALVDFIEAMDALDTEAARRLSLPEFRWLAPPSTLTGEDRSVDDVFRWLEERAHQVSSVKNWSVWPMAFTGVRDRSR